MTALPFTIEEARERARELATEAARLRSITSDHVLDQQAYEASREAATLREYARLREAVSEIGQTINNWQMAPVHRVDAIRAVVVRLNKEG